MSILGFVGPGGAEVESPAVKGGTPGEDPGGPSGSKPAVPPSEVPQVVDWRTRRAVGPVQDQLDCGSCVSFATTGLVGSMAAIEFGANLHLSEADAHFCSAHGATCGGWSNVAALSELQNRGVIASASLPYLMGFDDPPVADPADTTNHYWLAHSRDELNREEHCYRIDHFFGVSDLALRKLFLALIGPLVCRSTSTRTSSVMAAVYITTSWASSPVVMLSS
jgi:hypothetical protein